MPWKECHVMDERLRFVARLLEGEKMAPLSSRHPSRVGQLAWTRQGAITACLAEARPKGE
jgi:hypothetical protein